MKLSVRVIALCYDNPFKKVYLTFFKKKIENTYLFWLLKKVFEALSRNAKSNMASISSAQQNFRTASGSVKNILYVLHLVNLMIFPNLALTSTLTDSCKMTDVNAQPPLHKPMNSTITHMDAPLIRPLQITRRDQITKLPGISLYLVTMLAEVGVPVQTN